MNYWADMRSQDPESALQIATNLEALLFIYAILTNADILPHP